MQVKLNPLVFSENLSRKTRHPRRQITAVLALGFADYEAMLHGGTGSPSAIVLMILAVACSVTLAAYFIWLISRVCRLVSRHPKVAVTGALVVGGYATWRAYTTSFDSTAAATAWSCLSAAMALALAMYAIYKLIGYGPMPAEDPQH